VTAPALTVAESISTQQRAVVDSIGRPEWASPTTSEGFLAVARWLELEASRGYPSSRRTLWCAANMRLAAAARENGEPRRWTPGVDRHAGTF